MICLERLCLTFLSFQAYSLAACQFLGSLTAGVGMPSIRDWANAHLAMLQKHHEDHASKVSSFYGGDDAVRRSLAREMVQKIDEAKHEANDVAIEEKLKQSELFRRMLDLLWAQTVVDITNTLHEAVQMVLMDQAQSVGVRKKRGEALAILGEIFEHVPRKQEVDEQKIMEEIAFFAMLDTVRREEESAQRARMATPSA